MFGKFRNCTFTLVHLKTNGGIGICIGLIVAQLWPELLSVSTYSLAVSIAVLAAPTIIAVQEQLKSGQSLEQKSLNEPGLRIWS